MSRSKLILIGAVLFIAAVASFVASASPDGLERVAADLGFEGRATTLYAAPLPDYAAPNTTSPLSGPLVALLGTALVGGLCWGAGRLLVRRA